MSNGFIFWLVLDVPPAWTLNAPIRAVSHQSKWYTFDFYFFPESVIFIDICDTKTNQHFNYLSPQIFATDYQKSRLAIVTTLDSQSQQFKVYFNGREINTAQDYLFIQKTNNIPKSPRVTTNIDKQGIRCSVRERKKTLYNYLKEGFNTIHVQRRWNDLRREYRLLKTCLNNLNSGDTDYIVSVSVHLRKIIGRSKGNHLLQDCASFNSKPIFVWRKAPNPPNSWTLAELSPELSVNMGCFSVRANDFCTQLTDLDVWLSGDAAIVAARPRTQLDLLHDIADKVGAHSDWKERNVVEILESFEYFDTTALNNYLITLAENVLLLIERLERKATCLPSIKY